jgi:hypothetical protein
MNKNNSKEKSVVPNLHNNLMAYNPVAEWVPVDVLEQAMEWDRTNNFGSWEYSSLDELQQAIEKEGMKEPLVLQYSIPQKSVLLIEGNHRLAVAKSLGYKYLPTKVIRNHYEFEGDHEKKMLTVRGIDDSYDGHIPSEMRPSFIGLPSKRIK